MDLKELIRTRRTIQTFTAEKVSDALVKEALELSLWAPNHKLTFPWVYFDVRGKQRQKLGELLADLKAKKKDLSGPVRKSMIDNFLKPSHFVLLGMKAEEKEERERENYATLACSVQIASMVLWEKGVGSKWSTSGFTMDEETYDILDISPKKITLHGGLFIGMPADVPEADERPPLEDVLR